MEKVSLENAPETNGWVYGRINPKGRNMPTGQKFCHSCHDAFSGQDSLGYPAREVRLGYEPRDPNSAPVAVSLGDPKSGAEVFQTCASCHNIGEGAANAFGPVLTDIVGRKAGSYPGYKYSPSLNKAGKDGLIWTEQKLFEWLEDPTTFLRGHLGDESAKSKMPIGFDEEQTRNDVIAYLSNQVASSGATPNDATSEDAVPNDVSAELSHGDTPSMQMVEAITAEPDEIDALPHIRQELVAPPFLPAHTQKPKQGRELSKLS